MLQYSTAIPKLVSRQFGDEIVVVNYDSGLYYSLLGTGAQIWLGLNAGASIEDIVAAFSATYPSSVGAISAAIPEFVDYLLKEGLIVQVASKRERQTWSPMAAELFVEPMLERFEDLRDLLLLDPVHDVDEAGWPVRADDAS
jgi:hypothetical protein